MHRHLACLAAVLVVLACVGCGSEPPTPSPTPVPTPTPAPTPVPTPAPASCDFGPGWAQSTAELVDFEPSVVSATLPENVALKVKVNSTADQVRIELASGSSATLDAFGGGRFCRMLSSSDVLYDYKADDVNHNFVGFVDMYAGGTRARRLNGFIDVVDDNVPSVPVRSFESDAQATGRVFNLLLAAQSPEAIDLQRVARRFYEHYADSYDFLCIVSVPRHTENRHYISVHNSIQGTGQDLFDYSQSYGSAGRLMGIVRYPIGDYYDLGETAANHEIGHHFANWLRVPALQGVQGHWPVSSLDRGVMQVADQSGQGVDFPYTLTALGGGDYRLDYAAASQTYNDLELYLMGLAPASEVGEHFVFVNQNQGLCWGCILHGPTATLSVADVIAKHGPRLPAYPDAPRTFRLATIVVSMDRLLTAREMAFYDHFAGRGEATTPLPFTSGFARGTTLPFRLATGGRGTFVTSLEP